MNSITTPPAGARIVILTGAGISQESGLETFRDPNGIWAKVRIEDVATPEAFARAPERVHAFYNMRRKRAATLGLKPNAAHVALAELEQKWPGNVLVVTQNVDSFHERAGTTNLIHMHGRHAEARCNVCAHVVEWSGDLSLDHVCQACGQAGGMRPNVVWFGETPLEMDKIQSALLDCDHFMSIGTSGNVYPAAGFVGLMRQLARGHTVELNLEPSQGASLFAEVHYGPATEIVPRYVAAILGAI
jgi:NAD-dependent deacetylase